MPKIQVLDPHTAELIAAGEVVERPSSVIKELVENSIDAGASIITVEIRHGGVQYMRVTDNGCGIDREDVETAFLRHATSKVRTEHDLEAIGTLGFRGEALASIVAVSKVDLITRTPEKETGTHYAAAGGEAGTLEEAGCPVGTTITVRDLFYNVPARMKFLKKDVAEGNAVAGLMDKIALSHPEISFRLIREGKETLHTPGDSKLVSAVYAVFGREFSKNLIEIDSTLGGIRVHGCISTPIGSRPNRSMQNFFINGRFVRSRTAAVALEEAYKGSIMVGKFPACVLHLELSAAAVDVNVHPTKLEVRFVNERPVFDAVFNAVRSALTQNRDTKVIEHIAQKRPPIDPSKQPDAPRPVQVRLPETDKPVALPKESPKRPAPYLSDSAPHQERLVRAEDIPTNIQRILDIEPKPEFVPAPIQKTQEQPEPEKTYPDAPVIYTENALPTVQAESAAEHVIEEKPKQPHKLIGEAFDTYIILQYDNDTLMFIDKHAAHERLLYEKLKAQDEFAAAQTLLAPVTVTLEKNEYTAVLQNLPALYEAGFEVEDFGSGTVLVRSAPLRLEGQDITDAVLEIAGYLAENRSDITSEHMDWLYHNIACRAAIKGGNASRREELIALAEKLEENPEVRYCPHGRPIYVMMKKRTLEKEFGRV